jgi:hypothetical protein
MTSISTLKRMQQLTWVLIYGGLLTLVLGLSVQRSDDALGWTLVAVGAVVALAGFALVVIRARMKAG